MGKSSWRYASFIVSLPVSAFALDETLVDSTDTEHSKWMEHRAHAATYSCDASLDPDGFIRLRML